MEHANSSKTAGKHPSSWLSSFRARVLRGIVEDVPASLEECESCREADCTQESWLTCARRLGAEATTDDNESLANARAMWATTSIPLRALGADIGAAAKMDHSEAVSQLLV